MTQTQPAEEPFTLAQMAPKQRRRWPVVAVIAVVLLTIGGVAGAYALTRSSGPPARVVDGIPAPNPKCISDVQDLSHPWIMNGWWAGRVDGQPREMSSAAAMAQSLAGSKMQGVWLCPPKNEW